MTESFTQYSPDASIHSPLRMEQLPISTDCGTVYSLLVGIGSYKEEKKLPTYFGHK